MDGYSIKEAATVLGVPKRRVWELIARGVLSGAPEGDGGMRVFLQPRPGKASPLSSAREEPPRTNGNGGRAESGEGSPFREILTEFRSLTERYGQALLALGEARGEVAALRSRVELLEARLDLRLPGPRTSSTVAWEMPEYTPPPPPAPLAPEAADVPAAGESPVAEAEPAVAEAESPVAEADVASAIEATEPTSIDEPPSPIPAPEKERPDKGASRRRRLLRSHSAIAGIAEALERAQDPTLADLPGAREAAEALAALQREVEARTDTIEPEASVEEAAAIREPELQAEPAAEASFVEPAAATPAQDLVDEEPSVDVPTADLLVESAVETELEQEPIGAPEPQPAAAIEAETDGEPDVEAEAAGVGEAEHKASPVASAPSPYTTEVVEPDWFADGDFTWLEAAQAESASIEEADRVATVETQPQAGIQAPPAREAEGADILEVEAPAAPAAEAIQDAFEPPETDAAEPEIAVAAERPEPGPEHVAESGGEPDEEHVDEEQVDEEQLAAEAAPSAAAIQDAFDETFETAEPHEPANADAGPAAEAIQDAFEPPEPPEAREETEPPELPASEAQVATATTREEPFAPADVAVFAVDQAEPERAGTSDSDADARPPEARMEPTSTELPPTPPRTEGLGGLAVKAAAPPAVQPATPATSSPEEEELMWLGDEFEAAGLEIAAPGWRSPPEPAAESSVQPFSVAPLETREAPAHGMSDVELQQIAQDEGWDADEVDAIRTLLGRPTTAQSSEETDEQVTAPQPAAFSVDSPPIPDEVHPMEEVAAVAPEPAFQEAATYQPPEAPSEPEPMPAVEWPMAEPVSSKPPPAEATAPEPIFEPPAAERDLADTSAAEPKREPAPSAIEESIRRSIAARPSERRPSAPDPEWLRRRRGPAARAYRRLRRLLPG